MSFESPDSATAPDGDSVTALLPASARPDHQAVVEGLRPEDPSPDESHPGLVLLRNLNGAYARADRRGRFRLQVPQAGRYFLLVVSANSQRPEREQLRASDVAEIGRYFVPVPQLIGTNKFQWNELLLLKDRQVKLSF